MKYIMKQCRIIKLLCVCEELIIQENFNWKKEKIKVNKE